MTDERIRSLLEDADRAAGPPRYGPVRAGDLRRRWHRQRLVAVAAPGAVAAAVLFGVALLHLRPERQTTGQQDRIASLEDRVQQLQAQTDATLKLVQEVLAKERQEQRLEALQAELASIPDPAERLEKQADKTAFTLVYQADRMYRELNQTESAVEAYEQVIRLFPQNRWADVARERLSEIRNYRINKSLKEGESPCEPHESRSSV